MLQSLQKDISRQLKKKMRTMKRYVQKSKAACGTVDISSCFHKLSTNVPRLMMGTCPDELIIN